MSYGHADKIAAIVAGAQAAGDTPPIDPRLFDRPDVRRVLAERDIGGLYRALNEAGVPQRRIAKLTGQAQSEVSEIVKGRRVIAYNTLVKIAEGLGIPRERMGLSYGGSGAYGEEITVPQPPEGVTDEMLRRHFIAGLAAAAFGRPLLAGLLDHPPAGVQTVPLPSRLALGDVADLRAGTEQLRSLAKRYGGQADIVDAVANRAMRLLSVPADDAVQRPSVRLCLSCVSSPDGAASISARTTTRGRTSPTPWDSPATPTTPTAPHTRCSTRVA